MKLESIENEFKNVSSIETMDELHSLLKSRFCDYDRVDKLWYYVVEFVDVSTDSVLFCSCYDSPVLALRELPAILEKTKSNVDNLLIQLRFALPKSSNVSEDCVIFNDIYLSPYLYFKKPDSPEALADNKDKV